MIKLEDLKRNVVVIKKEGTAVTIGTKTNYAEGLKYGAKQG